MKTLKNLLRTIAFLVSSAVATFAGQTHDLPAVGGYDLVSYHNEDGPVRGSGFHKSEYEGVTYLFANEANKAEFDAKPEAFLPAYNGFCAYGVSVGQKFNSNPKVYEIVDGTLYLNLDRDIQQKWAEKKADNIAKADVNWKQLQHPSHHAQK